MASNLETAKTAYTLFQRGEISTMVKDIIDDDCTWISPGPKDKLPWAGTFNGKQGVADFFGRVEQNLEFNEFTPAEMLEQGETIVVIGKSSARAKPTGKIINDDWVHVLRFRHGKLVFFQE